MEQHDTILLACGQDESRRHLRELLQDHYNLLETVNIAQTIRMLHQNQDCICAMLVDTSLRSMTDKLDLVSEPVLESLREVPVIVISQDGSSPDELALFFRYGATDVIPLHYEPHAMVRRIQMAADLYIHKLRLRSMLRREADTLRHTSDSMVDALSAIIEYRSVESGNHILRVRSFTRILMEEVQRSCPEYGITDNTVSIVSSASALHDIGKIAIPDGILTKPGPLTREEWEIMRTHAITGCRILENLTDTVEAEYLRYAHNICHYHHERWDGKGYPEGLAGDQIPICAQVVGLADAYDALTSQRVYKRACSYVEAGNMILNGECGEFSPKLLDCFKRVSDQFETLTREYSDGRKPKDSPFDMSLPLPSGSQASSLEHARALYYSLIHYLNAFVVEVDMTQELFHIIYNPFSQITAMDGISTLRELQDFVLERIVIPQERQQMLDLFQVQLPRFMEENHRRASWHFHHRGQNGGQEGAFELTLLQPGSSGSGHRSLLVLGRKWQERRESSREQQTLSFQLPAGSYICRNDTDFTLVRMDAELAEVGGYTPEEIRRELSGKLSLMIPPEDRQWVREEFDRQLKTVSRVRLEHRVLCRSGRRIWVSNHSRLISGEDGREYLYCSLSDVSQTREALEKLNKRMQRYEVILAQTENALFEWNMETDEIVFSDTSTQVFGRNYDRWKMHDLMRDGGFFHPDDMPLFLDCLTRLEKGSDYETTELRVASHRGRYKWFRFRASTIRDPRGILKKVIGIIINIDAEKQFQRSLQDRAERDSLTRLLNKEAARSHAEAYLSRFPEGVKCSLLVIDLDNFKGINDQYGHLFGDAVLTKAARCIEKQFQAQDIVARIGGDEFMVLVRGVADRTLLELRCRTLIRALEQALLGLSDTIRVSCSIGIALAPQAGKNYYDLFAAADQALYCAKTKGKNTFCFHGDPEVPGPRLGGGHTAKTPIDSDLEPGLAEDSFVNYALKQLYTAADENAAVNQVLSALGRKMNVSRVYVFENDEDNLTCRNTFEWCNEGITAEIHNLQKIRYDLEIPGYPENFNEQGVFYCPDAKALPAAAYDIVAPQNIRSMLQCAIRENGVFRGFIGFDECMEQRLWTKEEIQMLTLFSNALGIFLLKHRMQVRHRRREEELSAILEAQPGCVYILDPDTHILKYCNREARQVSPMAKAGMLCYQALAGRQDRCPGCPLSRLREGDRSAAIIPIGSRFPKALVEATPVRWQGESCCMVSCRPLPEEPGERRSL